MDYKQFDFILVSERPYLCMLCDLFQETAHQYTGNYQLQPPSDQWLLCLAPLMHGGCTHLSVVTSFKMNDNIQSVLVKVKNGVHQTQKLTLSPSFAITYFFPTPIFSLVRKLRCSWWVFNRSCSVLREHKHTVTCDVGPFRCFHLTSGLKILPLFFNVRQQLASKVWHNSHHQSLFCLHIYFFLFWW